MGPHVGSKRCSGPDPVCLTVTSRGALSCMHVTRTQLWRDQRERRFRLNARRHRALTRTLRRELPTVSYIVGSGRSYVVTTYLDTAGLDYTTLAERSAGNRSIKVRVREYIALFADGTGAVRLGAAPTCYFERKE